MEQLIDPEQVAGFENATWSRCAKGYMDGFGALVEQAIKPLLDEVNVSRGDRVLDVGCGPGLVAAAATARSAAAIDIDFSEAMVTEAGRLHPGIEFRIASAEALPFADGAFDAVVGNFVLHHSGRPTDVLREAFRLLRGGGRVGFTVWADPTKLKAFGLFFAAVAEHAGPGNLPHGPLFGVSDFAVFHQILNEAGFHDSSVREIPMAGGCAQLIPSSPHLEPGRTSMHFRVTFERRLKQRSGEKPKPTDLVAVLSFRIPPFFFRR